MDNDNQKQIFIFRSTASNHLHAFADDRDGSKLPAQFQPWDTIGVVAPGRPFPYNLPRATVEAAIERCGFQLWRKSNENSRNPSPSL